MTVRKDTHACELIMCTVLDPVLQFVFLRYTFHYIFNRPLCVYCVDNKLYVQKLVTVIIISRLTPAYAFCILMSVTLWPKFGEGPLWPEVVRPLSENCRKYWWSNLLYINNFYPSTEAKQVITQNIGKRYPTNRL